MQRGDEVRRLAARAARRVDRAPAGDPQDERRRLPPLVLDLVEQHFPELANALIVHPQPHAVPIDAIVTEAAPVRLRADRDAAHGRPAGFADLGENPDSRAPYASPPCFMHELAPSYLSLAPERGRPPAHLDEPARPRGVGTE